MLERLVPIERSLIVACDVEPAAYEDLVEKTIQIEGVSGYKVGCEVGLGSTLAMAVAVVRERRIDKLVIYDHQKAGGETPDKAPDFARTMDRGEVDAAIVYPNPVAGLMTAQAYIEALQAEAIRVLVGAEMTHAGASQLEGGMSDSWFWQVLEQAAKLGVRDIVLPGNKPDRMAHYRARLEQEFGADQFAYYATGFVAQGGEIAAARGALGNFHAIIGRAIFEAADIRAAATTYAQHILEPA